MAPRREFKGKVDYQERAILDDSIEKLTQPTNTSAKIKELVPKSHRMRIGDGLYDKGNWLRDAQIGMVGLGLFKVVFSQQNSPAPINSIWELDVGKLIVPGVFMDVDLLTQIANNYDSNTRTMRNVNGGSIIEITNEEFRRVFQLSEVSNYLEPINFEMLAKVYEAQTNHLRNGPLKEFFAKIG